MYYANHVLIQSEAEQGTLSDLVQHHQPEFLGGEVDAYKDHVIPCPSGTRVIGPDDGEIPLKPLASVHVRAGMTKAHVLTGPVMFDPYLLVPDVKVRNVATGEEKTFSQHGLSLGFNTAFAEGTFYEQPLLATYYYCDLHQRPSGPSLPRGIVPVGQPGAGPVDRRDQIRQSLCSCFRYGHHSAASATAYPPEGWATEGLSRSGTSRAFASHLGCGVISVTTYVSPAILK